MAFPIWLFFPLTFLICYLIPFSNAITADQPTQALIDQICKQTIDFNFCNQSITLNLESPHEDIIDLIRITTTEAWKKASRTHQYIVDTLIPKASNPKEKDGFVVCENSYLMVQYNFAEAFLALHKNQYEVMKAYQEAAPQYMVKCKTDFFNPGPLVVPNWQVKILSNMAIIAGRMHLQSQVEFPI